MFKVKNKDTRMTPWRRSGVIIFNFERISHVNTGWDEDLGHLFFS